jgi:hypothetical protein
MTKVRHNQKMHPVRCTKAESRVRIRLTKETGSQRNSHRRAFGQRKEYRLMKVINSERVQMSQYTKAENRIRTQLTKGTHSKRKTGHIAFGQKKERKHPRPDNSSRTYQGDTGFPGLQQERHQPKENCGGISTRATARKDRKLASRRVCTRDCLD